MYLCLSADHTRLFEEEQKQAQELLQAQDNAVELKCRALQEMMMSIKAREEEMVMLFIVTER